MGHRAYSRMKKRFKNSKNYYAVMGILSGFIVLILALLGFAYLVKLLGAGNGLSSAMANIALVCGCFTAGFTAAKHRRKNGLKTGLLMGIIIYTVVYVIGAFTLNNFVGFSLFTKFVIVCLAAAIGGIMGVNVKIK